MNYDRTEGGYILELRPSQEHSGSGEAACVDSHCFPFPHRWSELFGVLFVHKQKMGQFYYLSFNTIL